MARPVDFRRLLPDPSPNPPQTSTEADSPAPAWALAWLAERGFGEREADLASRLEALAGDVGTRRYWRLRWRPTERYPPLLLVVYPPDELPAARRFLATTDLLSDAGVRVPRILAHDLGRGSMAIEDLGERTVYERRDEPWEALAPWFEAAGRAARRIAGLPAEAADGRCPPLDAGLLRQELRRTRRFFFEPLGLLAGAGAPAAEAAFAERWERSLGELCSALGARPPWPCHRDFMVRNLIPLSGDRQGGAVGERPDVGVLDHQDLRLGPPGYDLASLLNDSLFPPAQVERDWIESGWLGRHAAPGQDLSAEAYHAVAAQRTLKAVGTYAAFAARGRERHLRLIAPTLERALGHLAEVTATAAVAAEARGRWAGALAEAPSDRGALLD